MKVRKDSHVGLGQKFLALKLCEKAQGQSCRGPNKIFRLQTPSDMQREFCCR